MTTLKIKSPSSHWKMKALAYLLAVVLTTAMVFVRMGIGFVGYDAPMLIIFIIPIMVSAFVGGLGPGLAATIMSILAADYFLIFPVHSLTIGSSASLIHLAMLGIVGISVSLLFEALHRSRQRVANAQQILQQSEEHFRALFESSPLPYQSLDANGCFINVNQALLDALGYSREEVIGRSFGDFLTAADRELFTQRFPRFKELGRVRQVEFEMIRKDGRHFHIAADGDIGYTPEGLFRQTYCILSDITERRRAQQECEMTIAFLRVINESTSTHDLIRAATTFIKQQSGCEAVGVRLRAGDDYPYFETRGFSDEFVDAENSLCSLDCDGRVVHDGSGNPVLECMCGNVICGRFDPDKPFFTARGSFWSNCTTELLASTTDADRQARTRNRCNGEGYESVALVPLHVGGQRLGLLQVNDRRREMFSAESIAVLERLAGQIAVALVKISTEIALRESENSLQRNQWQLLRAKSQLEIQNKELEMMIGFISHDLRTPLVNINGFSGELQRDCTTAYKLLSETEFPQETRDALTKHFEKYIPDSIRIIQSSAEFMNNVVLSLVQVARAGVAVVTPEEIEMDQLVAKVTHTLETKIKESGAQVHIGPLPSCIADKTQVTQIFANLIGNALKYLEPSRPGRIAISGTCQDNHSIYVIEDNGIGIEQRELEKIFEMFYRLGDKAIGGEGIGLSIVKRMIDRNHGQIWVESQPGKGSRFCLALPKTAESREGLGIG